MARKPRIEFPGALYHVFSRGNNKQMVFICETDFEAFLERIKRYSEKYLFKVYAYVLMPNHFHIVLETHIIPISKIMQGLLQSYTLYFHKNYGTVGHLFQGRYKAILCDKETYLKELVRYITLNPVRADIVSLPENYKWSSYYSYFGDSSQSFVDIEFVFNLFDEDRTSAKKLLWAFIRDGLSMGHRQELYDVVDQRILGSEEFVNEIKSKIEAKNGLDHLDEPIKTVKIQRSLTEILNIVSDVTEIPKSAILSSSKELHISRARGIFTYVAVKYLGFRNRKISNFIKKDPSSVTHMVRRIENSKRGNSSLSSMLEKVIQLIQVFYDDLTQVFISSPFLVY